MSLTVADLQKLQNQNPEYQMELIDGNIVVMGPSDYVSEEIVAELARLLGNWARPRKLGRVTTSSAGFILPDANLRAPDVSFVIAERLRRSPRSFAELVPDLVVEVKSASDNVKPLREKIKSFLELGAKVGIFINPDKLIVEIYRPKSDVVTLKDGDLITIPELLPGLEIAVSDLWPPVYEEQ